MKPLFKLNSIMLFTAATIVLTSTSRPDEAVVKPFRYQSPGKSQFVETTTSAQTMVCPACKSEFVPTVTQDTKLRVKTVFVAKHGCSECKTTVVRTGAQKATGKEVKQHTCGAIMTAMESCCAGMK